MVPAEASIGEVVFSTALFPKDGSYLVPLKNAVRRAADVALGDEVAIEVRVARKD